MRNERLFGGALLLLCLALRPYAVSDPVVHVLIQLPLLALAGYVVTPRRVLGPVTAISLVILAGTTIAFWMLPRSIDLALENGVVDAVKFLTIPTCIGAVLALAWPNLPGLVPPFLKAQVLSMLGVLGFLYLHAPIRICNAYLVADQERLGLGFLLVAGALVLIWTYPVFSGSAFRSGRDPQRGVPI